MSALLETLGVIDSIIDYHPDLSVLLDGDFNVDLSVHK